VGVEEALNTCVYPNLCCCFYCQFNYPDHVQFSVNCSNLPGIFDAPPIGPVSNNPFEIDPTFLEPGFFTEGEVADLWSSNSPQNATSRAPQLDRESDCALAPLADPSFFTDIPLSWPSESTQEESMTATTTMVTPSSGTLLSTSNSDMFKRKTSEDSMHTGSDASGKRSKLSEGQVCGWLGCRKEFASLLALKLVFCSFNQFDDY